MDSSRASYLIGVGSSYIMYFIYMFGPLIAVAGLALSTIPPFRRAGLFLFLFLSFLYVFLPTFTAPAVATLRREVVGGMLPAIESLNSGVLSKMGDALRAVGDALLNYFMYIAAQSPPPTTFTDAALEAIGGAAGLTDYLSRVLYAMAELLLGVVVAFISAYAFARALTGAAVIGLEEVAATGRILLLRLAVWRR